MIDDDESRRVDPTVAFAGPTADRPSDPPPDDDWADEWRDSRRVHFLAIFERRTPARFLRSRWEHVDGDLRAKVSVPPKASLVLSGPAGSGKTYACYALCRASIEASGAPAEVVRWPELLEALRPGGEDEARARVARLAEIPVLGIDEIGSGSATAWAIEQFETLMDRRWRNELPTIATTNLEVSREGALADAIGPRAMSRLIGDGAIRWGMSGPDRRTKC